MLPRRPGSTADADLRADWWKKSLTPAMTSSLVRYLVPGTYMVGHGDGVGDA